MTVSRGFNSIGSAIIKDETKVVSCPACSSTFFESVAVQRYRGGRQVILGQPPEAADGIAFYLLRCCKCQHLIEPELEFMKKDFSARLYDQFLDEIEK